MALRNTALRNTLQRLAETGVIPAAAAALKFSMAGTGTALREAVLAEVPAFTSSGNPDILPGLQQHGGEHLAEIHRLFEGGEIGGFDFVKAQAQRRAEQRFPLEGTLHAYRCGHRILALWLREAALSTQPGNVEQAVSAVADFAIEYTNIISTICTAEYVAHTRLLAEAEGDRRTELLNILLSGYDELDGRVAQLLKRAGYLEQRQAYCVVVAQATNASEMEHPGRAQRIVTAIATAMEATPVRVLAGIRNNLVTAILSDKRRLSGWTAPQSNVAERVRALLEDLGPSVLIGISADHPSTAFIPKALHEAMIAFDFAGVAARVVQFSGLPLRDLLVRRGSELVQSAAPPWIAALLAANAKSHGALVETLRAVADADLNMQKAARLLKRHPNTVYTRLERIHDITGCDGQHYRDLTELLLAVDCFAA